MGVWAYRRVEADWNYKASINFRDPHKSFVFHRGCRTVVPRPREKADPSVVSSSPRSTARRLVLIPLVLLVTKRVGTCAMEFDRRFTAIKDAGPPETTNRFICAGP